MTYEKTNDYKKRLNKPEYIHRIQRKSGVFNIPNVTFVSDEPYTSENEFRNSNFTHSIYSHEVMCSSCGSLNLVNKAYEKLAEYTCSSCKQIKIQKDLNYLAEVKFNLEDDIANLNQYLASKKSQCRDNIESSKEIKNFINLTMQHIKRKIELELESKRDEMFKTLDTFVQSQKKINSSIRADGLLGTQRLCDEINDFLLMSQNSLNHLKLNNLKIMAEKELEKMNKYKNAKIPLYSIIFVPDSSIQIHNTFGKIVLKAYQDETYENIPDQPTNTRISRRISKSNMRYWKSTDELSKFDEFEQNAQSYDFKSLNIDPKDHKSARTNESDSDTSPSRKTLISRISPFRLKTRNQSQPATVKRLEVNSEILNNSVELNNVSEERHIVNHKNDEVEEYFSNFESPRKQVQDTRNKVKISSL